MINSIPEGTGVVRDHNVHLVPGLVIDLPHLTAEGCTVVPSSRVEHASTSEALAL